MKLRENKGIGLSDAIIAIAVFVIFSGVIITVSYNIYLESNFIKRNDTATNYIVDLFEYAQTVVISEEKTDEMIQTELIEYMNLKPNLKAFGTLNDNILNQKIEQNKGYIMQIDVSDINIDDDETYIANVIKKIDTSVTYKLGGKLKTISMQTTISR